MSRGGRLLVVHLRHGVCGLVLRSLASLRVTLPPLTFFLPVFCRVLCFFFFLARLSSLSFYLGLFCSLFLGFYLDTLVNDFPLFLFSNICIFTTLLRYNLYIVHLFEVYSSFSIFRIMQPSSPST